MLSLLKKSGGDKASSAEAAPAWRPDFRDVARLPDTKTVRTSFFVNTVVISATSALFLFVAHREWAIASLRSSLAETEARVVATQPGSDKAKAAYKLFVAEETKFKEAQAMVSDPFRFPDFVLHLGKIMPPGVSIKRIDFKGSGQTLALSGAVRGLDAAASDVASEFVQQLQADEELKKYFSSVNLTNLGRNPEEASLNMELVLTFIKPDAKDAGKKGGKK